MVLAAANKPPCPGKIRAALELVIASASFRSAPRLSAFLRFIVERTLAGDAVHIKGYTIGTQALGRNSSFDPQADPIVRVEAGRVRMALARYYANGGADQPVRIELPRGGYVPLFHVREAVPPGSNGHEVPAAPRDQGAAALAAVTQLVGLQQASALQAISTLDDLSARVLAARDLTSVLDEILTATIRLQAADFGTVRLLNEPARELVMVAQRGFGQHFLSVSSRISADQTCACGRALRSGVPVVIEDVETDAAYAPYRHIATKAGYRAVHATPLMSNTGKIAGMLATHFRRPHAPSKFDMLLTGIYSRLAAEVLARFAPNGLGEQLRAISQPARDGAR